VPRAGPSCVGGFGDSPPRKDDGGEGREGKRRGLWDMTVENRKNHARKRRKVRYAVVHGDTRWECESCTRGECKEKKWGELNQSSVTLGGGKDERTGRTFGNFDSLHRFVVHRAGAFFDELVALNTEIEDIGALHG
jgi:hypothetical protein